LAAETRRVLPQLPPENVLAEPRAASTGPALVWATATIESRDPAARVLSLHADWFVGDDEQFRQTAARALEVATRHDVLVMVGMVPTRIEPGYGHIEPGEPIEGDARRVRRFVEKPDAERARSLTADGALWNSGLFAWSARRFRAETQAVAREIAPHLPRLSAGDVSGFFAGVTPVAVDYSHFERSERVAVVPGSFPWDDVGTWAALRRVRTQDRQGNVLVGAAHQRDAAGCVVWSEDGAIVVDGLTDVVVVHANGVTLVTSMERAAQLKTLLDRLPADVRQPAD
jgi:mannose-1-phosphate guanylyltransferase